MRPSLKLLLNFPRQKIVFNVVTPDTIFDSYYYYFRSNENKNKMATIIKQIFYLPTFLIPYNRKQRYRSCHTVKRDSTQPNCFVESRRRSGHTKIRNSTKLVCWDESGHSSGHTKRSRYNRTVWFSRVFRCDRVHYQTWPITTSFDQFYRFRTFSGLTSWVESDSTHGHTKRRESIDTRTVVTQ